MAQLIKIYPTEPQKNRIICSGDLQTMKAHLDEIEKRIEQNELSKCGTILTVFSRINDFTLNTCVFKNFDSEDEESIDVNYLVIQ